ncbi:MAG: YkgJ family cysteine cluster protein [Myxococcales bacterium]|nr:YkgJ family cysteine cluster protein [Myxococcales bacterium]
MSRSEKPVEKARIRLDLLGQERAVELDVPVGPRRVGELLPVARALASAVTSFATEHAEAEGRKVSCRAGCSSCCHHLVPISGVEAVALARLVAGMSNARRSHVRRRFADTLARLETLGLLAPGARGRSALQSTAPAGAAAWQDVSRRYFEAVLPCPFLADDRCSIYDERPLVCREYSATTPAEWCRELSSRVETVDRPVDAAAALQHAANAVAGTSHPLIPLPLALEWAAAHGQAFERQDDGEGMFWKLLEGLGGGEPEPPT